MINLEKQKQEFFSIVELSRDDINYIGINADNLTDGQMKRIARRMCDLYLDNGYWDDLRTACDIALDIHQ